MREVKQRGGKMEGEREMESVREVKERGRERWKV